MSTNHQTQQTYFEQSRTAVIYTPRPRISAA